MFRFLLIMLLAGCATQAHKDTYVPATPPNEIKSLKSGFDLAEARQMLEFCIELNDQDDRLRSTSMVYKPAIDTTIWNPEPVFDSRRVVAHEVYQYYKNPKDSPWTKLYVKILAKAKTKYNTITESVIYNDPELNGFGPWNNAWLLYEGINDNAGNYAIAVRGTIVSNKMSDIEDALFRPAKAQHFLSPAIQFSKDPYSVLHGGFAHATVVLLLDEKFGIVPVLQNKNITKLYITGHSQGAAMATLLHAFFHYSTDSVFGLGSYQIKSYVFAQPKPGNVFFSQDFASFTQYGDSAITINNSVDVVPKVPLTIETTEDINPLLKKEEALHVLSDTGSFLRRSVENLIQPYSAKELLAYGRLYKQDLLNLHEDKEVTSWNFVSAGRVLYVYGTPDYSKDTFYQHHATTYRELLK
jgi:hypothetical protein